MTDMEKILVIDDEEDSVRVLSYSLRADGYEVVSATDGEEGLAVVRILAAAERALGAGEVAGAPDPLEGELEVHALARPARDEMR